MSKKEYTLLSKVNYPEELRKLKEDQLPQFCEELRSFIIESNAKFGGHFGASLGVVELTVAVHYVFDTPNDQLVWDVGHQAYGHKIITGRRDKFHTNRIYNGLSGFPKRKESKYDAFGVGHSSTSISAALGMSEAFKHLNEKDKHSIAVIGDGAMTAGMAFEGLNNVGVCQDSNLLIVLNDNCMAIDPNVGALKEYLTDIGTSKTYNKTREEVLKVLGKFNRLGERAQGLVEHIESRIKGFLLKESNLFESLNLRYFGPTDGHNISHLVKVLRDLKELKGPKLLHVLTVKGKGFDLAEKDQTKWHATSGFDIETGQMNKSKPQKPQPPKYQDVFGKTIVEIAKENEKVVGITPAMPSGSSLNIMMKEIPERAYDVGIAEQHAVTFAAGLATQGAIAFCNIYSSFMQRAYDQVVHDVAIQNLPVIFCLDRAGIAGADGPTHHGAYDIAYMRCVPNMVVAAPMNEIELRNMMYSAVQQQNAPYSIRYPRGQGVLVDWQKPFELIEVGEGRKVTDGEDVAILTIGHVGNYAQDAIEALASYSVSPSHYDMRFVKPLDEKLLHEVFEKHKYVITVEDGCIQGGFGSAVLEFMAQNNYTNVQVKILGIPDRLVEHGSQKELHRECEYDADAIVAMVRSLESNKEKVAV